MVRAKMRVTRIADIDNHGGTPTREVFLQPVYGDSPVNKTWSKYTPSGELRLQITNPDAFEQYKLGGTYFVDSIQIDDATEQPV